MPGLTMTFTLGNIVTIATIIGAVLFIYHKALKPIIVFCDEHNLLWEDYSIRRGYPYRVARGRNGYARLRTDTPPEREL